MQRQMILKRKENNGKINALVPWFVCLETPDQSFYPFDPAQSHHNTCCTAGRWWDCAFDRASMKFGTQSGYAMKKIFGFTAIADLSFEKVQIE